MKGLLRSFLINLFTLWLTSQIALGLKLESGWQTYILGAIVLSLILIFIKPLLKLLFLPINFLTLGFFSWIVNVVVLFLLTIFVPQIKILPFQFLGFSYQGFTIPQIHFGLFESFIVISFIISIVSNFFTWLCR